MKTLHLLFGAVSLLLLASCSVAGIQKHNPNFKTTRELRKLRGHYSAVDVKATDAEMVKKLQSSSLGCRLTSFSMPANMTVKDFIQAAFTDELDAAERLSKNGTEIAIQVNALTSDTSSFGKGSWTLDFSYAEGKKKVNIKTVTEFESAYMAETACRNTANALSSALTDNFIAYAAKSNK